MPLKRRAGGHTPRVALVRNGPQRKRIHKGGAGRPRLPEGLAWRSRLVSPSRCHAALSNGTLESDDHVRERAGPEGFAASGFD